MCIDRDQVNEWISPFIAGAKRSPQPESWLGQRHFINCIARFFSICSHSWDSVVLPTNMHGICMGKTPITSVTYENERISILKKNSLPYINCVLLLSCVVHGPIYGRFMGFLDMVELCRPVLQILSLTKILFSTPIFRGLFQTSCYRRAKLARLQHDTSTTLFQTSNLIQPNRTAVTENKTQK